MRLTLRILLSALLGLAVLAPFTAHAEKKTFTDARGDVQTFLLDESDATAGEPDPRPSSTKAGDVLRTAVSNTGERVAVKVRYAAIGRRVAFNQYAFRILGSNRQRHSVLIALQTGSRGHAFLNGPGRSGSKCDKTLRYRVDFRADTVSFSFPRSCIGSPRRIRVAHAHAWAKPQSQDDTEPSLVVAYDIAGRDDGRLYRRWGFSGPVRHTR